MVFESWSVILRDQPVIMMVTLPKNFQLFLHRSLLKLKISATAKQMLPMISSLISNASVIMLSH